MHEPMNVHTYTRDKRISTYKLSTCNFPQADPGQTLPLTNTYNIHVHSCIHSWTVRSGQLSPATSQNCSLLCAVSLWGRTEENRDEQRRTEKNREEQAVTERAHFISFFLFWLRFHAFVCRICSRILRPWRCRIHRRQCRCKCVSEKLGSSIETVNTEYCRGELNTVTHVNALQVGGKVGEM